MTIALALKCSDGIVVVTDGKITRASTSYRAVARIWQLTNKAHAVPPHVLVAGAGEVAMVRDVIDKLNEADDATRARGIEGLLPIARREIVEARAETVARHVAIYGAAAGPEQAPRAYFLFAQATPEPAIVYMSEDGDVEDQTHLGYAVTGSGDLIMHVRMQPWDTTRLTTEQGAILAYGLVKDMIDSGTFRVSDPVQLWTLKAGAPIEEWDTPRLEKLSERYHEFQSRTHDLLRSM